AQVLDERVRHGDRGERKERQAADDHGARRAVQRVPQQHGEERYRGRDLRVQQAGAAVGGRLPPQPRRETVGAHEVVLPPGRCGVVYAVLPAFAVSPLLPTLRVLRESYKDHTFDVRRMATVSYLDGESQAMSRWEGFRGDTRGNH